LPKAQAKFEAVRKPQERRRPQEKLRKALYRAKAALRNKRRALPGRDAKTFHRFPLPLADLGKRQGGRTGKAGVRHCTRSRRVHEARKRAKPPAPSSFTPSRRKLSTSCSKRLADVPVQLHLPELPDGEIVFDKLGECLPSGANQARRRADPGAAYFSCSR